MNLAEKDEEMDGEGGRKGKKWERKGNRKWTKRRQRRYRS